MWELLRTHGDVDVLDNDVACPSPESQPFTPDDSLRAYTNKRLVARNIDGFTRSVIVRATFPRSIVACVTDPELAFGGSLRTLGRCIVATALAARGALAI